MKATPPLAHTYACAHIISYIFIGAVHGHEGHLA